VSEALAPDAKARSWATVCHLSALIILSGAPFGNVVGPLIVYLIKKDDDPFIAAAGREALNFQIFISICAFLLGIVYFVSFMSAIIPAFHQPPLRAQPPLLALAILPLFLILGIFDLASVIVAAIKTNKGEAYRYPISLRFVG
jgi:uncharacterized protein